MKRKIMNLRAGSQIDIFFHGSGDRYTRLQTLTSRLQIFDLILTFLQFMGAKSFEFLTVEVFEIIRPPLKSFRNFLNFLSFIRADLLDLVFHFDVNHPKRILF